MNNAQLFAAHQAQVAKVAARVAGDEGHPAIAAAAQQVLAALEAGIDPCNPVIRSAQPDESDAARLERQTENARLIAIRDAYASCLRVYLDGTTAP